MTFYFLLCRDPQYELETYYGKKYPTSPLPALVTSSTVADMIRYKTTNFDLLFLKVWHFKGLCKRGCYKTFWQRLIDGKICQKSGSAFGYQTKSGEERGNLGSLWGVGDNQHFPDSFLNTSCQDGTGGILSTLTSTNPFHRWIWNLRQMT